MLFSRIRFSGSGRVMELLGSLADTYDVHRLVWRVFGDGPERRRDFLYHVKEAAGPPTIYAVSARLPVWCPPPLEVETKELTPSLTPGARLGFLLRANPVRTREGKRHDVVMEEKRRLRSSGTPRSAWPVEAEIVQSTASAWLGRRAEGMGFRLVTVRADGYRQHLVGKPGSGRPVRLSTVDFTGVVEVVDPERFVRQAMEKGVGPAKGFGCGLLLTRRL